MVNRFLRGRFDQHRDDYVQAALAGLWHACQRFEPERGLQFSTFATQCVRGYVLQAYDAWTERGAHSRGLKHRLFRVLDTDTRGADGEGLSPIDAAEASADFDTVAQAARVRAAVIDRLRCMNLPVRTIQMVEARFFEHETLEAIGARYGISKTAVMNHVKPLDSIVPALIREEVAEVAAACG